MEKEVTKVSEKQMDRFEGMLTQLVSMVGHLKNDVESMKSDMDIMKSDMDTMKSDMDTMKSDINTLKVDMNNIKDTQERQHFEVMGKLELLRIDQEITWTKSNENERDISRLKKQFTNM